MDKTDAKLKALEKNIKTVYTKAYKEMKDEASALLAKIQLNPEMPLSQKMALMSKYDRLNTLSTQLANTAYNANTMAQKMINNEMVNIYELNYNESAERLGFGLVDHTAIKKILKEEENPFNMISSLYDKTGIRNQMKGELMQGLLRGESIQKIARRFKNVSEKSLKDSIRIARTETTRVQNSAKMDIGKHGQELGFEMWKRWVATTDGRVREDHLAMNGVEVPQDEPFVLPDGSKMMFPADMSLGADVSQVVNCRCTMIEFVKETQNNINENEYEETGYRHQTQVAQGKDIVSTFERREDEFKFEIEDAINQQGFDGKPRIVNEEEFNKAVEDSGFVAQRTYSADSQEVLDAYREQLYDGKWYVDCSKGGNAYGQGMYSASSGSTISENLTKEMIGYKNSSGLPFSYTETFTIDSSSKIIDYDDLLKEKSIFVQEKRSFLVDDFISRETNNDNIAKLLSSEFSKDKMNDDDLFDIYGSLTKEERGLYKELLPKVREYYASTEGLFKDIENMDIGAFGSLKGYDAIKGAGQESGVDYYVILNRTKVIFKK